MTSKTAAVQPHRHPSVFEIIEGPHTCELNRPSRCGWCGRIVAGLNVIWVCTDTDGIVYYHQKCNRWRKTILTAKAPRNWQAELPRTCHTCAKDLVDEPTLIRGNHPHHPIAREPHRTQRDGTRALRPRFPRLRPPSGSTPEHPRSSTPGQRPSAMPRAARARSQNSQR